MKSGKIVEILKNCDVNPSKTLEELKEKNVVIVSVIGTSEYFEESCDGGFKRAFQLAIDAFGSPYLFREPGFQSQKGDGDTGTDFSRREMGCIDGFYTDDGQIIFLHLEGAQDPCALLAEWKKVAEELANNSEMGYNETWGRVKSKYCRSLLLLFSISHLILVSCSGMYFDTNYIQLFRVLDTIRLEVRPIVTKLLSSIDGVNKSWKDHGRICSPRVLFLFKTITERPKRDSEELPVVSVVKQDQRRLEDEIFQVLRKCRVVTNISANSLFAIPSSQDYVFIFDEGVQELEQQDDVVSSLSQLTITFCEKMCEALMEPDAPDYKNSSKLSFSAIFPSLQPASTTMSPFDQVKTYQDVIRDFREFVGSHTALAHTQGFDDDSRRVAEHKHFFVLPTFGPWIQTYTALYNYFVLENHSDPNALEALTLSYKLNTAEVEYLESQCSKMLPKMYTLYLKNLPDTYSEKLHKAKVNHVVEVFLKAANGPEVRPWIQQLISKCDKYWKAGRQQCEARSLHEHTCCHAQHRVNVEDHLEVIPMLEMNEELPEKSHCTGQRLLSYCNCGHKQGTRDEPFTIREANFDFYDRMKHGCCDDLDSIEFPSFALPAGKEMIHPQEMLLLYQQKVVDFVNKYEAPSQDLEDELRQESSLEFESDESGNEEPQEGTESLKKDLATGSEIKTALPKIPERIEAKKNIYLTAAAYSEVLPRSEQENEIIYKRIRERKNAVEVEQSSVAVVDQNSTDVVYEASIREMVHKLQQEIRDGEKKRRELSKFDPVACTPAICENSKAVKEKMFQNLDSTMKLMALDMKQKEYWSQYSKRLPSSLVEWTENYQNSLEIKTLPFQQLLDSDGRQLRLQNLCIADHDSVSSSALNSTSDYSGSGEPVKSAYPVWSTEADGETKSGWRKDSKDNDFYQPISDETSEVFPGASPTRNTGTEEKDTAQAGAFSIQTSESNTNSCVSTSSSQNLGATPKAQEFSANEATLARILKYRDRSLFYLPGMLHSRSLPGLLPLFSSWSLVCVGSSSLYTHSVGVTHQPGFITGSTTLLPWDKMVKAEAGVSKPVPRLIRGRKPSGRTRRITDEFSVKVFVGTEYECKRGHRFFLESPDKVLYINSHLGPPNLKEAARAMIDSDIPLYFRCPCKDGRDSQPVIAQLMRLHVITPKAPVSVTVNPRVQPGPTPCPIFYPGNVEPIKLTPSSYWILRLPYCYVGDDQVYVPSKDVSRYNGKLLKGCFDVESMNKRETLKWEAEQLNSN